MKRARLRTQADTDEQNEEAAAAATIDCSKDRDIVHHEFAEEADINHILRHFGADKFTDRTPYFGDVDYHLELQHALDASTTAIEAHRDLPAHLKARYPTLETFLRAIETDSLDLSEPSPKVDKTDPPKADPVT